MSLRARLLLAVATLLSLALVVSGGLVVGVTRANLVDQLDEQLRTARRPVLERLQSSRDADDPSGRRVAWLLLDRQGRLIDAVPSGFAANPDPLPSLPDFTTVRPASLLGRIIELPSVDGSISYRALMQPGPGGRIWLLAAPLTAVDGPIRVLVRNLLAIGGIVLVAVVVAGWLVIRRDLRPLEEIARTATRIADGDLSRRAEMPVDGSEVGRLGTAFDTMLDRIQAAFEEQQAALESKEASEARLRQFVADASHELRTPLTAVSGYVDLYRTGGLRERPDLDNAMARIGRESRRMTALVEDLLLLARLDQGRPLRSDLVDLSAIVGDGVADLRALQPERPVVAAIADGVLALGDDDRLRQVVGNLLANARIHTPPDAGVSVTLEAVDAHCVLTVADRGPGVAADRVGLIFDRFYRADPARSRDRGGSGLGLSIARSVVEAHGGEVTYSPTPGGGATFSVTLPLAVLPGGERDG